MRKFRFIGSSEHYAFIYEQDKEYNGIDSVLAMASFYPWDWEEVFDHRNTDLGVFSIEILKVIVSKNYDPVMGFSNSYDEMSLIAKNIAKELIKKL